MPTVSVLMPSYNHAPYVRQAIASIERQSFADWELLVVDDGSTDGSQHILSTLQDPRIRVTLLEQNRGACYAMNVALSQARGSYIAVLNSDDMARPDRLAMQLQYLAKNPALLAAFALPAFIDEVGLPCDGATNVVFFNAPSGSRARWLRYFIDNTNCLCHPTLLARRALYEKAGNYDNTLVQLPDFDMWVRALQHGEIAVQREVVIDFRMLRNGGNASAPTIPALMRCQPELYWIARQFFRFSDDLLAETFSDVTSSAHAPSQQPKIVLLEYLIRQNRPYSLLAALDAVRETLMDADDAALRTRMLGWTGQIDPFGLVARSQVASIKTNQAPSFASAFGRR